MKIVMAALLLLPLNLPAAAIESKQDWAQTGRLRFEQCEFKDAARAFTKALQFRPNDARLHIWLGRSYARMAESATLLTASGNARHARKSYERAIELEPTDQSYIREVFDFYLDSPQWFRGGLDRAALLIPRISPDDPGEQAFLGVLLADARQEYRGPDWRLRQALTLHP